MKLIIADCRDFIDYKRHKEILIMRMEKTIKEMEMRIDQDNMNADIDADAYWVGFEDALLWVQNKIDITEALETYEIMTEELMDDD